MPSTIFSGSDVKTLTKTLDLNGGAKIISSNTDPTSVAVDAPIGSILLNESTGDFYKKNDAGSSTNWTKLSLGGGWGAWTSFTPTVSWSNNLTATGQYRQDTDKKLCQVSFNLSMTGTPTGTSLVVTLPASLQIDTSVYVGGGLNNLISSGGWYSDASTSVKYALFLTWASSTQITAYVGQNTQSAITTTSPVTMANNDYIRFDFEFQYV